MAVGMFAQCAVAVLLQSCLAAETAEPAQHVEAAGVKVQLVDYRGPAAISAEAVKQHRLQINVDPRSEQNPLIVGVELPISGRNTWPAVDVEVLDSNGQVMSVRRGGIEWHKLLITVPAGAGSYIVHVVDPPGKRPQPLPDRRRNVTDPTTGLHASIDRWFHGRRAALSLRFDDSHPTHLTVAIPTLREYGFRGTFMVNPGSYPANSRRRSAFVDRRREWEACAERGDQEFANHTMHHRGAENDESMEAEIGDASKALWKLFPGKSKLTALNLGGGTQWVTTKTLRYYLDKYHLFDASANSTGMDDTYGNRVATFRRLLENHIARGLWYKVHFHYIGKGLSTSEANFRAALDIAKAHESELWIAGMADIYKYQTERDRAELTIASKGSDRVALTLTCSTDADLYDQQLTIAVTLPSDWSPKDVTVKHAESGVTIPIIATAVDRTIRFDASPVTKTYLIENTR